MIFYIIGLIIALLIIYGVIKVVKWGKKEIQFCHEHITHAVLTHIEILLSNYDYKSASFRVDRLIKENKNVPGLEEKALLMVQKHLADLEKE